MTLCLNNNRYIIEFKMSGNKNALEQIKEKRYYKPYENEGSKIYLVGISLDNEEKNIRTFKWKEWK